MITLSGVLFLLLALALCLPATAQGLVLPGTEPLTETGDLAQKMVDGIDRHVRRETEAIAAQRANRPAPDRDRLRALLGNFDPREPAEMEVVATLPATGWVARTARYRVLAVRWPVFHGVYGEGLLVEPIGARPVADIVALPDADTPPEALLGLLPGVPASRQYARHLAGAGCRVLIPTLIDRKDTYSGIPDIGATNQPHREFLWRACYELGRHLIGFELQKIFAAVDFFEREGGRKIGVTGEGEGGLLAFWAAALDTRIDVALVSGYFQPREGLGDEPIYRSVFGLLREFGDAEIARLIAPRRLIVEASPHPKIDGPPQTGRRGGAPGRLVTPPFAEVEREFARASSATAQLTRTATATHQALADALGLPGPLPVSGKPPRLLNPTFDPEPRHRRAFEQIAQETQRLMRTSPERRAAFWSHADRSSAEKFETSASAYRRRFLGEVIGALPEPTLPPGVRTRRVYDTPAFTGYEVTLDVYPDVFAYGILLVPKALAPGERRPVVVCQHGLEGRPQDVADPAVDSPYYHRFACQLAQRGYVTFAPQNPYIGEDRFRMALRRAQPIGQTLFGYIVRQHERILAWLGTLPFVDPARIAFYGLSYGGKTAMRLPAILPGYCLSICSADYNEWIWKNVSMQSRYSYLLTGEYDMPEWNLADTFNYAEMSWLIFPRPFMVERGHDDGVAPDEWVAYEFARTRALYDRLGHDDRTAIEFFNGPHTIHGVGTFAFLDKHLRFKSGPVPQGSGGH